MVPDSEHYLQVTEGGYDGVSCASTGGPFNPFASQGMPYNHLRPVISDQVGCMFDYEHRDGCTSLWGPDNVYGRSLTINQDWNEDSTKSACCNIEYVDRATYMSEWLAMGGSEPEIEECDL